MTQRVGSGVTSKPCTSRTISGEDGYTSGGRRDGGPGTVGGQVTETYNVHSRRSGIQSGVENS